MSSKLDLYRIFSMVAKRKSISGAAKDLFMSQPAVSQAIMQLEKDLEIRLFNRTPKGVSLTNEGSLLFEYVQSALNLIEAGEEKILELKHLTVGELSIGVGDTISKHFLLPYLEVFHNRFPNIKFKIVNGTTLEICALIKSGEVDLGICNFPIDDPALEQIPCLEVQDIFVCGEKFRHILSQPLKLDELVKLPLILLESNSNSRQFVESYFDAKGISLSPEFELGSYDLLLEFAKINLGIACVTKEFSLDYLEQGILYEIELAEPIPRRSIGVCYLNNVPLAPASTKFVELIGSSPKLNVSISKLF